MDLWNERFTIRLRISDLRVQHLHADKRECNVKTTNDIEADFVDSYLLSRKRGRASLEIATGMLLDRRGFFSRSAHLGSKTALNQCQWRDVLVLVCVTRW